MPYMLSSVPIYYSVRYFRLALNYLTKEQKVQMINKYKASYLYLAENFFKNGDLLEAWYFYYELNKINPLKGKHRSLFEFSDKLRLNKIEEAHFKEFYEQWPLETAIPYGIFLLKRGKKQEVQKILKQNPEIGQNEIGFLKLDVNLKKIDLCELRKKKSKYIAQINSQYSIFKKIEKLREYETIINIYYEFSTILKKSEEELDKIKDNTKQRLEFIDWEKIPLYYPKNKNELNFIYEKFFSIREDLFFTDIEKELNEQPKINNDFFLVMEAFSESFLESPSSHRKIKNVNGVNSAKDNFFESSLSFYEFIETQKSNLISDNELKKIEKRLTKEYETVSKALELNPFSLSVMYWDIRFKKLMYQLPFFNDLLSIAENEEIKNQMRERKNSWEKLGNIFVFISHSKEDFNKFINLIIEELTKYNAQNLVLDTDFIKPGMEIEETLKDKIKICNKMLVFISLNSLTSDWVGLEIKHFFELENVKVKKNTDLIPIVIDETYSNKEDFEKRLDKEIEIKLEDIQQDFKKKTDQALPYNDNRMNRLNNLRQSIPDILSRMDNYNTIYMYSKKEIPGKISDLIDILLTP